MQSRHSGGEDSVAWSNKEYPVIMSDTPKQLVELHDAKAQLARLIEEALAGAEVQIARSGKPLVRLVPVGADEQPRQGGQLRGKIWMAPEFDAPKRHCENLFDGDEPSSSV